MYRLPKNSVGGLPPGQLFNDRNRTPGRINSSVVIYREIMVNKFLLRGYFTLSIKRFQKCTTYIRLWNHTVHTIGIMTVLLLWHSVSTQILTNFIN